MLASKLPVTARARTRVAFRIHTALREMGAGRAGVQEFRDLCDAVNVIEVLCDMGKLPGTGLRATVRTAQMGMEQAAERIRADGRSGVNPEQFEALRAIVAAYDEAMGRFSGETMERASAEVTARIIEQTRNPANGVEVVDL